MPLATLLIDDDRAFCSLASAALQREGLQVRVAHSLHEARKVLEQGTPDLVILDRLLPDGDGLSFLPELKAQLPDAVVVMVTALGDIASAVDAIRSGAADYVAKPIELTDLVVKAKRAADQIRIKDRLARVEEELSGRRRLVPPSSPQMRQVLQTLERCGICQPSANAGIVGRGP